jgi:hypothetical protein
MLRSLILLLSCAVALNSVQAAESSTPVGRKVEAFTLKDYRGAAHSLSDFDGRKLMVVAF